MNPTDIIIVICCSSVLIWIAINRYISKRKGEPKSCCSMGYGCSRADEMKRAMRKARREIRKEQ